MLGEMTFDGRARGVARINNPTSRAERESLKEVTGKKEDKDAANRGKKFKKRRGGGK